MKNKMNLQSQKAKKDKENKHQKSNKVAWINTYFSIIILNINDLNFLSEKLQNKDIHKIHSYPI